MLAAVVFALVALFVPLGLLVPSREAARGSSLFSLSLPSVYLATAAQSETRGTHHERWPG